MLSDEEQPYTTDVYKDNYLLHRQVESLQSEMARLKFGGNEKIDLTNKISDLETKLRHVDNNLTIREMQVFALSAAITEAAFEVDIVSDPNLDLSGPQLLLLVHDMADYIKALQKENDTKADWIEATLNDMAEAEYQKSLISESVDIGLRHGNIPPGLYRVHWKSGGSSVAAIGVTPDGSRWIAPTNWVSPSLSIDLDGIDSLELIDTE